jgi:O-succinylbenzoic acid--CoA ligase
MWPSGPERDLLAHRAAATPAATALVDTTADTTHTYRDLDERAATAAARLAAAGIEAADRVGLLVEPRPAFVAAYFGVRRLGATAVLLDPRRPTADSAARAARIDCVALVAAEGTAAITDETNATVFSVDASSSAAASLFAHDQSSASPAERTADTTAIVAFTSGTTGEPKAVRLTVGNLLASATASAFRLGVDPDDRWLCCLPPCHVGGLAPVLRATAYGTTAVLQPAFDAHDTAAALAEHDCTGVSLVPTQLSRLLDADWSPPDSLRFVLLGGAPADRTLLDRCREQAVPVWPTYGLTETASQVATATPAATAAHPGTVGQPLLWTDVAIVDDDGQVCTPGDTGEIRVAGPTVTPGYDDPGATAAAFDDAGRLCTGDLGYRDEAGRLWVVGRRDERIVTGGENVAPTTVEAALTELDGVTAAAVVGLDDPEWGQRVGALLAVTGDPPDTRAIRAHCSGRLADYERPKTVAFVDALPRTDSGTVDRAAVRERLRETGGAV